MSKKFVFVSETEIISENVNIFIKILMRIGRFHAVMCFDTKKEMTTCIKRLPKKMHFEEKMDKL